MKKITTILLAATLVFTACDINRIPYGSMLEEDFTSNPEDLLDYTLNGCYAQLKGWSDVMHRCGEYAGDNIVIRGTSSDAFYEFISYSRTPNNGRLQTFWDNSYKVVAQSSNIIKLIPEGKDTKMDNKLGECYFLRGMMYFYLCRAYGRPYYQNMDGAVGGVPIVNGTPDDMFNFTLPDRSTVKESYRQAIEDLKKSEKLLTIDKGPAYASKAAAQGLLSRVYLYMTGTYEAPNSVYADSAIYYATQVIELPKYKLLDRPEFMKYNTIVPENNKESVFVVKRVASEFKGSDHYYGIGGMYSNIGGMGWGEMYASAKYLSLLDETGRNDWANGNFVDARAAFIEPKYTEENEKTPALEQYQVFRFIKNAYALKPDVTEEDQTNFNYVQARVTQKGGKLYCTDIQVQYEVNGAGKVVAQTKPDPADPSKNVTVTKEVEYELTPVDVQQKIYKIENYNTNTNLKPIQRSFTGVLDKIIDLNRAYPMFYITKCSREGEDSQLHSPIISRLGEIYLNRAEAYAKKGMYAQAKEDLNKVRERSLPGRGYAQLDATNASENIDKERQLELAFQAERSYDVYRNGKSLTRLYPGPHNAMEEVKANDYRVVYYIPQTAINSYPGTLTQNPTK